MLRFLMEHIHVNNNGACPSESNIHMGHSFVHSFPLTLQKICGILHSTSNPLGPITTWKTKACDLAFCKNVSQSLR